MKTAITATPSVARFAPILHRGSVKAAFALASELGYDGVELHLRRAHDVDRHEVVRLIRATGLAVPTLGTGMAAGEDGLTFADGDPTVRDAAVARVKEHIDLAAEVGSAVTIGLIWGRIGRDPAARQQRLEHAVACLAACCAAGAAAGVTLLLEPLNRYESDFPNTLADGLAILSQVSANNLRLLADTFHMNIEEADMAVSVAAAGQSLGYVHLVDSNRWAPGFGHSNLLAVVGALRSTGYRGFLSCESLPLPDTRQAAAAALSTIRTLLAEADAKASA